MSALATVLPAAAVIFLMDGIGVNWLLALLSVSVAVIGMVLLWRPGESPILFFTFAFPLVQGSVAIYHANWLGITVDDYSPVIGDAETAIFLSLIGVLALAVGMRLGAGAQQVDDVHEGRLVVLSRPLKRWFRLYAISALTSFVALTFAWIAPGLTQLMLALAAMKWAFFYMLALAYFTRAKENGSWLFPLVFLFELVTSLGGYFSEFKTVFFVTLFAAAASGVRFKPRALIGGATLAVLVISLGIVWSSVKVNFRDYASGGENRQLVVIDYLSRLNKLAELTENLDFVQLADGADQLLRRISYVEFFGAVLITVPFTEPHADGAILEDAVLRPFMPRLFFAEKAAINDTARTNLYTGGLAGTGQATSISVGYFAEAYIDFGKLGMWAELFGIGVFYGAIYRLLSQWRQSRGLLGGALATAVLLGVGAMENSFTKVFGSVVVSLLAAYVVIVFAAPRWAPWLAPDRR